MDFDSMTTFAVFKDIATQRHSTRQFAATVVSRQDLDDILATARTSPFASGRKGWDILCITDMQTISTMAQIVRQATAQLSLSLRDDFRESFQRYAESFVAFASAPVLFIPIYREIPSLTAMLNEPSEAIRAYEHDNQVKSISCVAMLVLLAAQAKGLGSCYMTGPVLAESALCNLLKIRNGMRIGAIIPVGHPHSPKE